MSNDLLRGLFVDVHAFDGVALIILYENTRPVHASVLEAGDLVELSAWVEAIARREDVDNVFIDAMAAGGAVADLLEDRGITVIRLRPRNNDRLWQQLVQRARTIASEEIGGMETGRVDFEKLERRVMAEVMEDEEDIFRDALMATYGELLAAWRSRSGNSSEIRVFAGSVLRLIEDLALNDDTDEISKALHEVQKEAGIV